MGASGRRLTGMTMQWNQETPEQFGITDAELWALVGASHSQTRHAPVGDVCTVCLRPWPCPSDRPVPMTQLLGRYLS